jgi:hypothetical protein
MELLVPAYSSHKNSHHHFGIILYMMGLNSKRRFKIQSRCEENSL